MNSPGSEKRFIYETGLDKPGHQALGRSLSTLAALEHGEFPLVSGLVQADDVKALVERPDFDVAVVRAAPAIECLDDVNLTRAEMNSLRGATLRSPI